MNWRTVGGWLFVAGSAILFLAGIGQVSSMETKCRLEKEAGIPYWISSCKMRSAEIARDNMILLAVVALALGIALILWGRRYTRCPYCTSFISRKALVCPKCSRGAGESSVQADAAAAAPAGWYPLNDGSGRVAWWDGGQWTDGPPAQPEAPTS